MSGNKAALRLQDMTHAKNLNGTSSTINARDHRYCIVMYSILAIIFVNSPVSVTAQCIIALARFARYHNASNAIAMLVSITIISTMKLRHSSIVSFPSYSNPRLNPSIPCS